MAVLIKHLFGTMTLTCSLSLLLLAYVASSAHAEQLEDTVLGLGYTEISENCANAEPTEEASTCPQTYIVQPNDSCDAISLTKYVSTYSIIKAGNLNSGCTNLQAGASLCLPSRCELYRVKHDETCESILAQHCYIDDISLLNWNPNINQLCTNLGPLAETLICVSPPVKPILIPMVELPIAPGTSSDCEGYVDYFTISAAEADRLGISGSINSCNFATTAYEVTLDDFLSWNPSLASIDPCMLQEGCRTDCDAGVFAGLELSGKRAVCVGVSDSGGPITSSTTTTLPTSTATAPTSAAATPLALTQTDIVEGCTRYRTAIEGDGCCDIANAYSITLDQFYAWNPAASGSIHPLVCRYKQLR
ncbi:hypothetical protein V497_06730 [Pseudogymnoascus sp. VKM F-4516 (FW-969)]|nr:hypothetical protein V497_06730 [Pseudogymnoascus sp. VKM F-4516 (FW-969)]